MPFPSPGDLPDPGKIPPAAEHLGLSTAAAEALEPALGDKGSPCSEKPVHRNSPQLQKIPQSAGDLAQPKIHKQRKLRGEQDLNAEAPGFMRACISVTGGTGPGLNMQRQPALYPRPRRTQASQLEASESGVQGIGWVCRLGRGTWATF